MARVLIQIKDKYFEWSTIVDAPVTCGMSLEQLEDYIKEQYGDEGVKELPERLARVKLYGTSSHYGATLKETISCNRAGKNEKRLTADQIYELYRFPEEEKEVEPEVVLEHEYEGEVVTADDEHVEICYQQGISIVTQRYVKSEFQFKSNLKAGTKVRARLQVEIISKPALPEDTSATEFPDISEFAQTGDFSL